MSTERGKSLRKKSFEVYVTQSHLVGVHLLHLRIFLEGGGLIMITKLNLEINLSTYLLTKDFYPFLVFRFLTENIFILCFMEFCGNWTW